MLAFILFLWLWLATVPRVLSQFPSALKSNLSTILSPVDGNITVSYKTPARGTCTTLFDTQEQFAGWVNIPGDYPTNTFFWFIAARDPTDQLTIWLNGGPGSSSMMGLFTENGPCEVVEIANGKIGTVARDWGWDRGSNMLYIDQPNQVGLSYDVPTNGSLDLLTSNLYVPPQVVPSSQPADTFMNGTFSSLNTNNTANTTETSAVAIWHFLQAFLGAFPQYNPANSSAVGVNLFAESYGGKYAPAFATLWEQMNLKRSNGTISRDGTIKIKLASVGVINGCVDDLVQGPFYPIMANNNTYGLMAINPTRAALANASFYAKGGCQDLVRQCRGVVELQDPNNVGDVAAVNTICAKAYSSCTENVVYPYLDAGRSIYDIGHFVPDPFPPSTYLEYLNTAAFQTAIGSPVNYTESNFQVVSAFTATGDYERNSLIPEMASLLNSGIRVALIYGDRDYICNWLGGEAVSLAVAANTASGHYSTKFAAAGYAPIITNSSYIGGVVRQYGNLSFSRIYNAGHQVPAYQPETAFQVFARVISGTSLSTGEPIDLSTYNTTGSLNSTHTNNLPISPSATCWLRNIENTCTEDQRKAIIGGTGVIINGVWYAARSDYSSQPASATTIAPPTQTTVVTVDSGTTVTVVSTTVATGMFVATATPTPSKTASGERTRVDRLHILALLVGWVLTY